jgi:hypothetical protein
MSTNKNNDLKISASIDTLIISKNKDVRTMT